MPLTSYQYSVMPQQIFGTMQVIDAFEGRGSYHWREGAIPSSENFRVECIRLGLQLSREQFALRFGMSLEVLEGFEQLPRLPYGTGVMFLRSLAERTNQREALI